MERKACILVVNDDPLVLRAHSRLLEREGYRVIQAEAGGEGLELVQELEPDLVLLDVVLPDVSGYDVCQQIKLIPESKQPMVMLLSGVKTDTTSRAKGLESGADDVIALPISNRELLARVRASLRLLRTERVLQQKVHQLDERVKELNCLYGISKLVQRRGADLSEILRGTVQLLPPAFQYPEIACARITWKEEVFETEEFERTPWHLISDLCAHGLHGGQLEVVYLAERPSADEGPFLREERALIDAVAERLGRIIERLEAEAALREEHSFLETVVETSPAGITIVDRSGKIVFANPYAERVLNLTKDEITERTYNSPQWRITDYEGNPFPDEKLPFRQVLEKRERVVDVRHAIEYPNGERRLLSISGAPLFDDSGEVRQVVFSIDDVTERVRRTRQLERLNDLLRAVQHINQLIVREKQRGRLIEEACQDLVEAQGFQGAWIVLLGDGGERLEEAAAGSAAWRHDVLVQVKQHGAEGGLEADQARVVAPLKQGERVYGWAGGLFADGVPVEGLERSLFREVVGDIAFALQAIELEEKHRQAIDELHQQERLAAVGRLAGGIAHDFNNILASIILYAPMPLTRHDELPTDVVGSLETVLSESRHGAKLVEQILDFSRSAMLEMEPLDLVSFVQDVAIVLRRTIPENVHLQVQVGSRTCVIEADATRIQQMLINLAANARDAMPQGGDLRIGIERIETHGQETAPVEGMAEGSWARIRVSDTGIGMSEEVRAHLFEPFFTTKAPDKGTGLGLSQVYGIVKQHDGYIDVESEEGEGTTFLIYLPCQDDERAEREAQKGSSTPVGRGETLLLVEDAEKVRVAIERFLESLGYRVLTAANGREAVELFDPEEVDLAITDVIMPTMGGEELLAALRSENAKLPVLAMTGYVLQKDLESIAGAGFTDVIHKPFDVEEIAALIRRTLDES